MHLIHLLFIGLHVHIHCNVYVHVHVHVLCGMYGAGAHAAHVVVGD